MVHTLPLLKTEMAVEQTIRTRELLDPGEAIVVAVSGGPDSVALLSCLLALQPKWGWKIFVGHVNHRLRGEESEEDTRFVQNLAQGWGVPVRIRSLELPKRGANRPHRSLQEIARKARYRVLEQFVRDCGASKLALGHTADDQAETVLMWMLRGCGSGGLSGMPPKREPGLIRPLLDTTKSEILAYLQERRIEYRTDSSNDLPIYLRNRLRQDLVPCLQSYSPGVVKVLKRQADVMRDDHDYLEELAQKALQHICTDKKDGTIQLDITSCWELAISLRRRVIRASMQRVMHRNQGPRFDVIEEILHRVQRGHSGWTIQYKGCRVSQEYNHLMFRHFPEQNGRDEKMENSHGKVLSLSIPSEVLWPSTGQRICIEYNQDATRTTSIDKNTVYFDAGTFTPRLAIRSRMPGDVFYPKGMGGRSKKLKDFFSDIKLPRPQRDTIPLLVAPEGILWVGGLREDERFQPSSSTTNVMVARIVGN